VSTLPAENQDNAQTTADPPRRWITGLSADMPQLDALEVIFQQRFQGVLHFLPRAADRAGENIDHVHRLRVSCRRLGAVLDVLAEGLPEAPRQSLLKIVGKIRRSCGEARDLDVRRIFLEGLLKQASVEEAGVVELMCEKIVCRRERAQKEVRRRLAKLEERLREAGAELVSSLHSVQREAAGGYGSFGQTGCRILTKELAALWDLADRDLESAATLHQLRIAVKHLRYAFEVFIPALDASLHQDFYPQLEEIQKLLGEVHDADEASRDLKQTRKKWKSWRGTKRWASRGLSGFRWRELRSGIDAVLLAYAQQADHARTEFLDLWPGFSGESFRRPISQLLAPPAPAASVADHDAAPVGE
jgi:CHAD domain-containing protein